MRYTRRRTRLGLTYAVAGVLVAAASIAVALAVTPLQEVTVLGERIGVGAAAPSLSVSGPGEVDLFGQRLPTAVPFTGPVRPRLALTRITLNQQLPSVFTGHDRNSPGPSAIGRAVASGWIRYFVWEAVIAGGCAVLLAGAIAGWARLPLRRTMVLLAAGLALVEAVNLGGIMVTAFTAPTRLRQIRSLTAPVGQSQLPAVQKAAGTVQTGVQVVVMGDSTAAGLGLPGLAHAGTLEKACHRSRDAYAADLAAVNHRKVLNLACSGATIPAGLLGSQQTGHVTEPAQLAQARRATRASVVIVSIGANDVGWSGLLRLCAVATSCANRASTAYFQQQQLARFTAHYYQLLGQLATLPSHPRVLINLYYDPFDTKSRCLDRKGLDAAKEKSVLGLLSALNGILAKGAQAAGQISVQPDFSGHALCDAGPYVQGIKDPAPFHPTAAGQLAIALADERALQQAKSRPGASSATLAPAVAHVTIMPSAPLVSP